jgi:methionine aminotransferase
MTGVPALAQAISAKITRLHGHRYDPAEEITITAGATQAILTAVLALVHPGDEVIVLEPCFDSYGPAIQLAGATVRHVPLDSATLRPHFDAIQQAINPRTRAIIINSPHNPSGRIWREEDLDRLAEVLQPTGIWVISDEVYEHMVFDGMRHASASGHPVLAARSVVISSFGKTFHVTGWKVGFAAAPAPLSAEFRKVHQFNVFAVNTPMQHGLAHHLADPTHFESLPTFYQRKRDMFRSGLYGSKFRLLPCEGSYFQCADYSAISDMPDTRFCEWLTEHVGVAAIPLSAFYAAPPAQTLIRFCFAKRDETLQDALGRLARL